MDGAMTDSRTFEILPGSTARNAIYRAIDCAPLGYLVKISPATRSLIQNSRLHALIRDIARSQTYLGRKMTTQQWKTLFISGHGIATGLGADMIPGLENEYVNVRESSAQMSVPRMSSLIDYIMCWQSQQVAA
jgi:hypothetical protein